MGSVNFFWGMIEHGFLGSSMYFDGPELHEV